MFGDRLKRLQRNYHEGDVIFQEGDLGDTVFLIKEGTVKIVVKSGGVPRIINELGAGEVIGEMGLIEERHHRTASIIAVSDVTGWKFSKEQFQNIVNDHKEFREKIVSSLVQRLNETTDRLVNELQTDRSSLELSTILLSCLDSEELEDDDPTPFEIDHSPEYLAYRFGTSLEIMQKFLSLQERDVSIEDFSSQDREKLLTVGKRILDDTTDCITTEFEEQEDGDPELVRITRNAKQNLDMLEDDSEEIDRSDLQDIMQERKDQKKVLQRHKEEGRSDYIVELLERMLNAIDREINRQHNQTEA